MKFTALALFLASAFPQAALGYVGPGTGMSAVGVFLAVVMGLFFALFGFVWYPIKRLLRMRRRTAVEKNYGDTT
ncbi:MAG: hypothetical protein GX594_19110 [Pirellulaceae bacterium]|nr:hypothetical protein [Pirellulaceae bacterium]